MMPRFFKDMPPKGDGVFACQVLRITCFGTCREVSYRTIRGRRLAYFWVRFRALLCDLNTPYCDGEVGINWKITRLSKPSEVNPLTPYEHHKL